MVGVRGPGILPSSGTQVRRRAAALGLLLLLGQALMARPNVVTSWLSGLALLAFAMAVCAGVIEVQKSGWVRASTEACGRANPSRRSWRWAAVLTAGISVGVVQMWFRPGGAIAGGDLGPPVGVAWIGHLFTPWWGTGSSLGGPNGMETQLPWAAFIAATHALGISGAVAEDAWFSLLVAGAAVAALALQRQLGIGPVPATLGAVLYVLSPLIVAEGLSPLYFACMALLAAGPALVLAVARDRLSVFHGVIAIAAASPMVGYVYSSPPLLGLVLGASLAAELLVSWLDGRRAAKRAGLLLAIGLPALLVTSLYWLVPSALQLSVVATHQLAALTSWTWTETRATVRNAFWLDTTWTWAYSLYAPFAPLYRQFPLSLLRFAPATLAFGALLVPGANSARTSRALRTTLALAGASLGVIFLSTGTLPPGSILFNILYHLPLGWLLQDPGRFLLAVALGYAVLCALSLQALLRSRSLRRWLGAVTRRSLALAVGLACLAGLLLLPAYPLLTGIVVLGPHDGLPSSHVTVPAYWPEMARFVNAEAPVGRLLVLPVDDFYQMPYQWYYGNDGFIMNQIARPVLDPVGQGYTPAAAPLLSAAALTQRALLAGNWSLSRDVLGALGVRLLLVRGDLIFPSPGRSFASPSGVSAALGRDPFARLLAVRGPLRLYGVSRPSAPVAPGYATTNVPSPDLRELGLLPPGFRLVSSRPIAGVPSVTQFPPVSKWSLGTRSLTASVVVPPGHPSIAFLSPAGVSSLVPITTKSPTMLGGRVQATLAKRGTQSVVRVRTALGEALLTNGNFSAGLWGPVGNCNAVPGTQRQAASLLHAALLAGAAPGSGSALRLSAGLDSACEVRSLIWRAGPLFLNMEVRHLVGAPPSVCLWEIPIGRCAALPALPTGTGWHDFQATITPDHGTTSLALFLYANSSGLGAETVNEYANITAVGALIGTNPVVVTWPAQPYRGPVLSTNGQAYSAAWRSLSPAAHVIVDGLGNGWLAASSVESTYSPGVEVTAAERVSGVAGALLVLAFILERVTRRYRRSSVPNRRSIKERKGLCAKIVGWIR